MNKSKRKKLIFLTVDDLVSNFLYYDRKEDEELSIEDLCTAIEKREISVADIVSHFEKCLIADLKRRKICVS